MKYIANVLIASLLAIFIFNPIDTSAQLASNDRISAPASPKRPIAMHQMAAKPVPHPFAFDAAVSEPAPLNYTEVCADIAYPETALEAGISGTVQVRVLVGESGEYLAHVITDAPDNTLVQAVDSQLSTLKFTPAVQNGKPIVAWTSLRFSFRIKG